MVKKEFTYRGYKLEDLKKMNLEEFSKLVTARKRRTLKRGFTQRHKKLIEKSRKNSGKTIKTHCRTMIILPEFAGKTFAVYNGKEFVNIVIEPEMIGLCLGEFVMTRNRVKHSAPGMGATRSSKYVSLK